MSDDVIEKAHLTSLARERTRRRLLDALDILAEHWSAAERPQVTREGGERRPAPASRPPLPIDPASALDAAWRDLRSWGQLIIEERDLSAGPRTGHAPSCPRGCTDRHPATGPQIARWLALHADWLAAHPAGDDCAEELHRHARRVRAIALGHRSRRFQIGRCPQVDVDEDGLAATCVGTLWALVRQEDDMLPDRVVCDTDDEHVWSPSQWPALGRRLGNLHPEGMDRLMQRLAGHTSTTGPGLTRHVVQSP